MLQAAGIIQQHLDHADECRIAEEDAEMERESLPLAEEGADLSFEQLAEAAHEQVQELLRRRREQYDHDVDGGFQDELEAAVEVLEIAMMPEDNSHLEPDGEPGVTDGGVPGG